MGKRFDTLLFPGGRNKVFTLSYDDGVTQDRRLVEIFNKYNVKCTFNLGYGNLGWKSDPKLPVNTSRVEPEEVKQLYRKHEVGGHALYHSDISSLGAPYSMYEILEDKAGLEKLTGYPLKMFAYPFGLFNRQNKEYLKIAGYKGARTVKSTLTFELPQDPYELNPTCHHNDEKLMDLAEQFVNMRTFKPSMFYVWGHAYEFDRNDNWDVIEKLVKYISENGQDIWFATNGEILDYIQAYRMLEYSVDGSMIYNPSATDVEIMTAFGQKEVLKAGKITEIGETPL
ncbi:MAG: polysaccharide deacetylase family protein [Erysipelotrichaceae bacterium]|nr:polysaccharide deacetylase family protein [Erysipelotrichaceae bacterium]